MRYAQSILELLNRLYRDGYDRSDLCLARDAYLLAMHAFTGLGRPSGKLFIDHAVGTASVLHDSRPHGAHRPTPRASSAQVAVTVGHSQRRLGWDSWETDDVTLAAFPDGLVVADTVPT